MQAELVKSLARECGFELVGVAPVGPQPDFGRFQAWTERGFAGEMRYLTDRRADLRADACSLLPNAQSVICVGKLYNQPEPEHANPDALLSRYALSRDYHDVLRERLQLLCNKLLALELFEYKICVDTAPLLERSYARQAGLGWIGRNTCLINEPLGSWFFLGEIVTTLALQPDSPPPDRCGTCSRCIDACPTAALIPSQSGEWTLDARRCIAYLNIELRGPIPEELRSGLGPHIFGCDICQDVCPWNSRAPFTDDAALAPLLGAVPDLLPIATLAKEDFKPFYGSTPVYRAKYEGFLRNAAIAMGNSGDERYRESLEGLASHASELVREHALWALARLSQGKPEPAVCE